MYLHTWIKRKDPGMTAEAKPERQTSVQKRTFRSSWLFGCTLQVLDTFEILQNIPSARTSISNFSFINKEPSIKAQASWWLFQLKSAVKFSHTFGHGQNSDLPDTKEQRWYAVSMIILYWKISVKFRWAKIFLLHDENYIPLSARQGLLHFAASERSTAQADSEVAFLYTVEALQWLLCWIIRCVHENCTIH